MKKILMAIVGLGLMAGCSACSNRRGPSTHDYDYVLKMFNEDLAKIGKPQLDFTMTDFQLVDDDPSINARCINTSIRTSGPALIVINKERLKLYPEYSQIATIYHELGHCFYGLGHTTGKRLMSPSLNAIFQPEDIMDEQNRLFYLKDMLN